MKQRLAAAVHSPGWPAKGFARVRAAREPDGSLIEPNQGAGCRTTLILDQRGETGTTNG